MLAWRIYYGDGSTFSASDGPPAAAPPLDVQVIVQATEKEGRVLLSARDYYWYDDRLDQWSCGDLFGLFDYLMRQRGIVKFGRSMRTEEFERLYRRAACDPDFPRKSLHNYAVEGLPR